MNRKSSSFVFKGFFLAAMILVIFFLWYVVALSLETPVTPLVANVQPLVVDSARDFSVSVTGRNLSTDMTAILTPNIDNNQAVVTSLPLLGSFYDSVQYDKFLYLGTTDRGLYVVDTTDAEHPRLLGTYLPNGRITDLLRVDDVLIVSSGRAGLVFFKILSDGNLQFISDYPTTHVVIECCYANGFLFGATGRDGVITLDLHDFTNPRAVGSTYGGFVFGLGVVNDFLILSSRNPFRLSSHRIHADGTLTPVDSRSLPNRLKSSVFGKQEFYVASAAGFAGFYVGDDGLLDQLFEFPDVNTVEKMFLGKKGLYLFKNYAALAFFDRITLSFTSNYFLADKITTLNEIGDLLFVSNPGSSRGNGQGRGLVVLDYQAFAPDAVSELYEFSYSVNALYLDNNNIYLSSNHNGTYFRRKHDIYGAWVPIASDVATSFSASGDFLFATYGKKGVEVFSVAQPDPVRVAHWPQIKANNVAVWRHFAVVSNGFYGVSCVDFRNLISPIVTDILKDVHPLQVEVVDGYVYLATKKRGLMILALADDGTFVKVGSVMPPFPMDQFGVAVGLKVVDGIAYIANGTSGLLIVDVANPQKPRILSSLGLPGYSKGLLLRGSLAIIFNGGFGVHIVDVLNPEKPRLVGKLDMSGLSKHPVLNDGLLFLPSQKGSVLAVAAPVVAERISVKGDGAAILSFGRLNHHGHYDLNLSNGAGMVVVKNAVSVKN